MDFKYDILFMRTCYTSIRLDDIIVVHGGYNSDVKRNQFLSNDIFLFNLKNNDIKLVLDY